MQDKNEARMSSKTTFHTDPIVGAVCAHNDETPFRVFWLGRGTSASYIGRCMNERGHVGTARGLRLVDTAKQFKTMASEFYTS